LLAHPPSRPEADPGCAEFVRAYERIWGFGVESPEVGEKIQRWRQRVTLAMWEYALNEGLEHNRRTWSYISRILERVEREGLPTQAAQGAAVRQNRVDFLLSDLR
jgi:DNA replication protein DnaD